MKVELNGKVLDVNDSYGLRLLSCGKAKAAETPEEACAAETEETAEEEKPRRKRSKE